MYYLVLFNFCVRRVFYDRLIDDKDRKIYFNLVKSKCQRFFKVDLSKILFPHMMAGSSSVTDDHLRSLFFGDYMYPEVETKIYDEIPDANLLTKAMEHYLNEHNSVSKVKHETYLLIVANCKEY